MRFQIFMLAENHKDGFARIGEYAALDKIKQPIREARGQIDLKAQAAFACLFAQCLRLSDVVLPFFDGSPVAGRIFGQFRGHDGRSSG